MAEGTKKDARTTGLLRRLRGRLFRASRLLDQPDTPWRRRRLLDSIASHGERIADMGGNVLRLTLRVPYGDVAGRADDTREAELEGRGLFFPGAAIQTEDLAAMAKVAGLPALRRTRPERLVVLDTETTGLLDEAETVPFLIGLGHFESDGFAVEQFFMEDFESEPAMMKMVARRMRDARALLTYNGSVFDLPLLRRRFALQRLPLTAWKRAHWDVLPAARRLWRGRVRSCSLTGLEKEVFEFRRIRDIASNRIPQVYRDYLGGRRAERLAAVFDHNAQDVLTTAALALTLARAFLDGSGALARGIADETSLLRFLEQVGRRKVRERT
jgi:hypothetical protein